MSELNWISVLQKNLIILSFMMAGVHQLKFLERRCSLRVLSLVRHKFNGTIALIIEKVLGSVVWLPSTKATTTLNGSKPSFLETDIQKKSKNTQQNLIIPSKKNPTFRITRYIVATIFEQGLEFPQKYLHAQVKFSHNSSLWVNVQKRFFLYRTLN